MVIHQFVSNIDQNGRDCLPDFILACLKRPRSAGTATKREFCKVRADSYKTGIGLSGSPPTGRGRGRRTDGEDEFPKTSAADVVDDIGGIWVREVGSFQCEPRSRESRAVLLGARAAAVLISSAAQFALLGEILENRRRFL